MVTFLSNEETLKRKLFSLCVYKIYRFKYHAVSPVINRTLALENGDAV